MNVHHLPLPKRTIPVATLDCTGFALRIIPRPRRRTFGDLLLEAAAPVLGEMTIDMRAALADLMRTPLRRYKTGFLPTRGPRAAPHATTVVDAMIQIGVAYRDFTDPSVVKVTQTGRLLARAISGSAR